MQKPVHTQPHGYNVRQTGNRVALLLPSIQPWLWVLNEKKKDELYPFGFEHARNISVLPILPAGSDAWEDASSRRLNWGIYNL